MKTVYCQGITLIALLVLIIPALLFTTVSDIYVEDIYKVEPPSRDTGELYTEVFNGVHSQEDSSKATVVDPSSKVLNVKYIGQEPNYPCGCEGVSAVMLLDYHGIKIDVDEFFNGYLDTFPFTYNPFTNTYYGEDMDRYYVGNPASSLGKGCYAPVIKTAVEKIVPDSYIAVVEQGRTLEKLADKYIKELETPILVWATSGMRDSYKGTRWRVKRTSSYIDFPAYMHCMVLVGYDDDKNLYYFNDPWKNRGLVAYDKDLAEEKFRELGTQALALLPKSEYRTEAAPLKDGKRYALRNAATGKYMTIFGDNIIQSTYTESALQLFTLKEHSDGSVSLINEATGNAVDIKGTNVAPSVYDGSDTQRFFIKSRKDGFSSISSTELPFSALAVYGNCNGDSGKTNLSLGNVYANDTEDMGDFYKLWEFIEVQGI